MKDVIKYLYGESMIKVYHNELWFNMENYWVVLKLSSMRCLNLNEDDTPYTIEELSFENLSKIKLKTIESITIRAGEYIPYDETETDMHKHYRPYTYITAELSKRINLDFPLAIISSNVGYYCVNECFMCQDVWEYGLSLIVSKEYWNNIEFYRYCTFLFEKVHLIEVPMFYHTPYEPKDNYEIKILSSNTKARRLGYLKIILDMFKVYPKVSVVKINAKLEEFASQYKDCLYCYKNNKGEVVRTKTGNSAKPYIELAERLGLIHKTVGYYSLGKIGRVYNEAQHHLYQNNQNPFVLNDFDVIFFMELLLKEDYLYLYTIITLTHNIANISYNYIRSNFKTALLKQCERYMENAKADQSFDKSQSIRNWAQRIHNWKKPEVYMEHVLMPRLNWLYDMDIISLNEDLSFNLTAKGKCLCYNLFTWNDINFGEVVSPIWFMDNYFMQIMDMILSLRGTKFTPTDYPKIKEYIDIAFSLFKTLAPNRVTFSQMSKYIRYMLCFKDNKMIESEDIKGLFAGPDFLEYLYRYQKQYGDGYVQKKQ